jgi:hypothetical protein
MGESAISRTRQVVGRRRTAPRVASSAAPSLVSTGMLAGFVVTLFAAALAAAAPAAAIDDPSRPDARVTHGPSCRPGGLVVEVRAGTTGYAVRLATTRQPSGEDEAVLAPGETAVLRSDDVAWGETIDGRLEYAAQDGSGATYVDELEHYSFTRPSQEDCEAITAPASPEPTDPAPTRPTTPAPTSAVPSDGGAESAPVPPPASGSRTPPTTGQPQDTRTTAPSTGEHIGSASTREVSAGGTVTLHGAGFLPGERVTIRLHGGGALLGAAVAGPDGTVQAEVEIPSGTTAGAARVDLVGDRSAVVTDVELLVAAGQTPMTPRGTTSVWSLVAAAVALVGSVGALISVAGSSHASGRRGLSSGGA